MNDENKIPKRRTRGKIENFLMDGRSVPSGPPCSIINVIRLSRVVWLLSMADRNTGDVSPNPKPLPLVQLMIRSSYVEEKY